MVIKSYGILIKVIFHEFLYNFKGIHIKEKKLPFHFMEKRFLLAGNDEKKLLGKCF